LATACRNHGSSVIPRLVFTGAELLHAKARREISSTFECDVLDYYGCGEMSLLMWECTEHMGFHMNVDSVATEFLNNGKVVGPGEEGEIVCTNLHNYAMPLIRYRLGDVGVPIGEQCSCDRNLPLMKVLRGRSDDLLTTPKGELVFASSLFHNAIGQINGIKQFRVIQEKKDRLLIQLVAKEGFPNEPRLQEQVRSAIQSFLGEDMQVDVQFAGKIERDPTGKSRVFISRIS
jgi:phenylacetate-CoA ligase